MSSEELSFFQRLYVNFMPGNLLIPAVYYNAVTFTEEPFLIFSNLEAFKRKAFGKLWTAKGKAMSQEIIGEELISSASGTVLDLGPGSGHLISRLDPNKISVVYGVEPVVELHSELLANAEKAGFGGKYKALVAGAEPESLLPALKKAGLLEDGGAEIFDTILCIRVLCSVRQKDTIPTLYKLLKPGGRMIVSEHVVSPWPKQGELMGYIFQNLFRLMGWKFFAGCSLNQDTLTALKDAGGKNGWASFGLEYAYPWHAIPYIWGTLVKS